jgi:hypothetical protein
MNPHMAIYQNGRQVFMSSYIYPYYFLWDKIDNIRKIVVR